MFNGKLFALHEGELGCCDFAAFLRSPVLKRISPWSAE